MNKCFSTNFHCSVFANEPPFFIEPTCGKLAIADCFNIDYRCRLHAHQKAKLYHHLLTRMAFKILSDMLSLVEQNRRYFEKCCFACQL